MSNTLPTPPGPVSQALSNAVYTVMARQGIESADALDIPEPVRQQVLGLEAMTTEGLATVAEALGVAPSQIVAVAQDTIDRHADCDHGHDDEPVLTDEPGKVTKLTGPDSVAEAIRASGPYAVHHRPRVRLDDLAAELGITQSTVPWQPLPPVDVLRAFDQTIPRDADDVSADHAATIREAWNGGER